MRIYTCLSLIILIWASGASYADVVVTSKKWGNLCRVIISNGNNQERHNNPVVYNGAVDSNFALRIAGGNANSVCYKRPAQPPCSKNLTAPLRCYTDLSNPGSPPIPFDID